MSDAIKAVLLPAIATGINPVPILAMIALLGTQHPRRNGAVFVTTVILVFAIVAVVDLKLLGSTTSSGQTSSAPGLAALELIFGLVFLAVFVAQWRQKPLAEGETPKWLRGLDSVGPLGCVITGVSLVNYALISSATAGVIKSGADAQESVVAMLVFILVATITLIVPYVLFLVRPEAATRRLQPFKRFLTRHSRTILMVVFGLMGALFVAQGIAGLLK